VYPGPMRASSAARILRPERQATVEEWLAIPEEQRAELIHGTIVYHAFPGPKHGFAQGQVFSHVNPYNRRRGGGADAPGGWWVSLEVDMLLGGIGCRPDVIGWRRDRRSRMPEPDDRGLITVAPDFICEVLSSSTARYDQGPKRDAYFKAGVTHYWLVDHAYRTITVLERAERGYMIALVAGPGEVVRAVPFDGVDIVVSELFLDEDEDEDP
jgi:Uma2 family endonuclease